MTEHRLSPENGETARPDPETQQSIGHAAMALCELFERLGIRVGEEGMAIILAQKISQSNDLDLAAVSASLAQATEHFSSDPAGPSYLVLQERGLEALENKVLRAYFHDTFDAAQLVTLYNLSPEQKHLFLETILPTCIASSTGGAGGRSHVRRIAAALGVGDVTDLKVFEGRSTAGYIFKSPGAREQLVAALSHVIWTEECAALPVVSGEDLYQDVPVTMP